MSSDQVFQFKIELQEVKPKVWRVIQVPSTYSFWDLHVAIQDAMGWYDYHLHEFLVKDPATGIDIKVGIPDDDSLDDTTLPGWEIRVKDYFSESSKKAKYIYDFGDDWKHAIIFEGSKDKSDEVDYPRCMDGKRACPPEDCGGPYGYELMLESLEDPNHDMHHEMLEWIGGEFDPEYFDFNEVEFDNPKERWKIAFEG